MDFNGFVLSILTRKIVIDLKNLKYLFDFSNSDENHELFSNKIKKTVDKFKIETPENFWIEEVIALRSKSYSFKCGDDNKSEFKGISKSQTKHIESVENKNCLNGEIYQQECVFLRSLNHGMCLQQIKKSTFSTFDEKRCYENTNKSLAWE